MGYSARPEKRLRHQLGIDKGITTEVLRTIQLPTGHDARKEEEAAHDFLRDTFPEWVVPKSVFGNGVNTMSEIYRPAATQEMHRLLDEIERRYPMPVQHYTTPRS
jgi:hypothetical protein